MSRRRPWGFRARLAALIAGVFIAGGVVLLSVQYLLVQQLFAQGISTITAGCVSDDGGTPEDEARAVASCRVHADDGGGISIGSGVDGSIGIDAGSIVIAQTSQLSEEVLSGLLLWSVIVLAVFAALAVLTAWWLSKRSLGRIAHITRTTQEITGHDLHRRLDLPGPDDEIKELGDTIDGMLDRLDEAFRRQDRFIAGASHELRTPLTTTRTLLEIPLAQGRVPAELQPSVRGALAANARSEQLIGALLTLARSAHAPARSDADVVDLSALARAALDERRGDADARGLRIETSGSDAAAAADPALAGIAVGNLLENAIRHNRDGGAIRIVTHRESDHAADGAAARRIGSEAGFARLTIENDGHELTAAEVARLAEPFHRGEQTRLAGFGTGLGLTLADTIARALGGSLTLQPRPGGGLIATLRLPARAASG